MIPNNPSSNVSNTHDSPHTRLTGADMVLIGFFFSINLLLFFQWGGGFSKGDQVVVEVDQKVVKTAPLSVNSSFSVQGKLGPTKILIQDGSVRISHSPCKTKLCIKAGDIHYAGRILACVPNHVVVRILGRAEKDLDAIVS